VEHAAGNGGQVINRFMHKNGCSVDNFMEKAGFVAFFPIAVVSIYLFE
jgi:hypothetical protein